MPKNPVSKSRTHQANGRSTSNKVGFESKSIKKQRENGMVKDSNGVDSSGKNHLKQNRAAATKAATIGTSLALAKKRKSSVAEYGNKSVKQSQRNGGPVGGTVALAKRRKVYVESASNSDGEDYIDQFFHDVEPADYSFEDDWTSGSDEDEYGDDYYDEDSWFTDEEELDSEEGAMGLEELMAHYGQWRDLQKKNKPKVAAKGQKVALKSKAANSSSKPVVVASHNDSNGWVEEDNDQDLRYVPSDEERTPKPKAPSKAASGHSKANGNSASPKQPLRQFVESDAGPVDLNYEDSPSDSDDDYDNDYDDDDDDDDDGSCSDSYDSEQYSDSDSEMWTDIESDDDSEDSGHIYMREPYDSDSYDEDYEPSQDYLSDAGEEELFIPRGNAKIYDINDDSILFDESGARILELQSEYEISEKRKLPSVVEMETTESDDECPPLVPIYNERGEFIDSPELLSMETEATPAATSKETKAEKQTQKNKRKSAEKIELEEKPEAQSTDIPEEPEEEEESGKAEEAVEMEEEESETEPDRNAGQASFYRFYDAIEGRMSLALLRKQIYFYGHLSVQPVFGELEIMGYRVGASETRTVNAVRGYHAVNLVPLPSPKAFKRDAFEKLVNELKENFIDADIEELLDEFDPSEQVLVLLQADKGDVAGLRVICNVLEEFKLFPTSNPLYETSRFRRTEHLLEVQFFMPPELDQSPTRPIPLFQKGPAWDDVQLTPSSRVVVVGGKGAGKSTLCQYLVNRYVKQFGRILLVDLDIGQPLVYLPETITASVLQEPLLGVGCLTNVQPLRCQLFGSLNVVSSPLVYIQNVRTLLQHCEAQPELRNIPWIVNTMGYVSGFGEELTAAIVRLVHPTDLVQLTIPRHVRGSQNYAQTLTSAHVNGFRFNILLEELERQQQQQQKQQKPLDYRVYSFDVSFEQKGCPLSPPMRRTLTIMAQLVKILDGTTEWFTDIEPFSAPLDELQILITRDEYTPTKDKLPCILNATMVYLCEQLGDGQYSCLGVGIVRCVDSDNNVQLLQYLPPEQLARAKVLALCFTNLPNQLYRRLNNKMDGIIPYLQNVG